MINREMLAKAALNNVSSRQVPSRTEHRLQPSGTSFSSTPVPTQMTRNSHVTVTLDGTSSARNLLQQHTRQYDDSLLRRQLNKCAMGSAAAVGAPPAASGKGQALAPERSLLAQHLTQRNNEPKAVELAPTERVRVLKTSGGTVTVRSLSPVSTPIRVHAEQQARAPYSTVHTEPPRAPPRSIEHGVAGIPLQRRAPPSSPIMGAPVAVPRRILPKPVHSLSFMANGSRTHQNSSVVPVQDATSRMRYVDVPINASPNDVITGLKNMAVVHPQVRPSMSVKPIAADELAKDAQLSKTTLQNMTANVAQKVTQLSTTEVASAAAAAAEQRTVLEPNCVVPVSIQRSFPGPDVQRVGEDEGRKSKMIIVDLTEPTETSPTAKQDLSTISTRAEMRLSTPPTVTDEPLQLEAGCLQVPSGLKVDFINLDDLLIGDLSYLAKYFGLSILEPLSMDDIANKGLSEWIDISDEAEVEKTFAELKALNGSRGQQLFWANRMTPESSDVAYPIVVPEYEELETTSLPADVTKPATTTTMETADGKASPAGASRSPRGTKEGTAKSPLILIIKKGANSSASSPAWQLSPCKSSTAKDEKEESKTLFCNALNLLPSSGEQLKKMRKGKSARALAVLKDKVMSEYLKNHFVPLHRVQGMYRYLFKKGHLREGKLTYACEVYRNLRSRENRPRASLVISRYDDEDFIPKKNQPSSPGLLWHLKKKKVTSKYEMDDDYVPKKGQVNGQKLRRSLWGRPKGSWRTAAANSDASSNSRSPSVEVAPASLAELEGCCTTPLYKLEAGNWTPKCSADDSSRWDIWVSENSLENKMSRPIPMVVLTRIEDCDADASGTSKVESPQRTVVSELFCSQCSYSCLNKPSLVNHFSSKHKGTDVSFKTVVMKCRINKSAPTAKGPST
ncbi:uncharacterized protein LOC119456227 isoform X2 [Dermacentor silvarum]|uniref:uncharacterized protein LOC119456227 isoform X2 n=1 Tax=Dermacentor silvarum TaxID=543639 RepID=UPI001899FEDD|nr:uncharacterized protein LOC119456227 isoform X2 [Dermacentor silvarum]